MGTRHRVNLGQVPVLGQFIITIQDWDPRLVVTVGWVRRLKQGRVVRLAHIG